jgi:hypothetical protein
MNVSELDFDIRVGLSKVEENIVGLADKEKECVVDAYNKVHADGKIQ